MTFRVITARVLGAVLVGAFSVATLMSCSSTTSGSPGASALAASEVHSYIVEAQSAEAAARVVDASGGEVVSRLKVIDAVEARLTRAQHARVLASTGIRQVTPNVAVTTMAAANVRDNFETDSFANNDGTHRWYGNWVEQNDDNNPNGGYLTLGWSDHGGKRLILTGRGAVYLPQGGHAQQFARGDAQVQVAAQRSRRRRIRVGAGQPQWHHLDRARTHLRPGERFEFHRPELRHHRLSRPQYRGALRAFDERPVWR